MSVTDADVIRAHPSLPALELLLDPAALQEATVRLGGGGLQLDRLRLKPGASVTAMLRPVSGRGPWVLARGLARRPWATKRQKDLRAAEEAGLASWELPAERLVLVPAAADRQLNGLAALRPDTGCAVPAVYGRKPWRVRGGRMPALAAARAGRTGNGSRALPADADEMMTVRTLSHNPARRWVGLAEAGETRRVLRLHSDRPAEQLLWVPGRDWMPGDPLPVLLADPAHVHIDALLGDTELPAALGPAVDGLRMIHRPWGERAAAVVAAIADRLARVPQEPAHGDLTPDQVVVGADGTTVVDWDRAGRWPAGWDAATWTAGMIVAGWHPAGSCAVPDLSVEPVVLAAAAIMRGSEPFRRREPDWAGRIEALLAHAELVQS
ncbi:MAG: hypothetical protein Q4F67_05135 [Propionibacteriaceae bacterium]|nr:hypothetical protein [Propionibacteriaceae bacterium]